jgi:hypothetical protein
MMDHALRFGTERLKQAMHTLSTILTIAMIMGGVNVSAAQQAATGAVPALAPAAAPAAKPKGVVIRGCLTGSKLTHIEPADAMLDGPDILRVSSIRVIRDQVKALNGHQVELIGTLRGIPGQDNGVLIGGSDKAKVYVGGADKNLGEDLHTERIEPPTIYAHTIKDVASACPGNQTK